MKQETLQDLMVVSTTSANIEEFNPKEAISGWVSSGTNKKHFITSTTTSTNTVQPWQQANDVQLETKLPPLPVPLESDDDAAA